MTGVPAGNFKQRHRWFDATVKYQRSYIVRSLFALRSYSSANERRSGCKSITNYTILWASHYHILSVPELPGTSSPQRYTTFCILLKEAANITQAGGVHPLIPDITLILLFGFSLLPRCLLFGSSDSPLCLPGFRGPKEEASR